MISNPKIREIKIESITSNATLQAKIAIQNEDSYLVANILSKNKITKDIFIELCKYSISCKNITILRQLIKSYKVFWKSEIFDELTKYAYKVKDYTMAAYLLELIDELNEYIDDVNKWNTYIYEKNITKPKFMTKVINLFKKVLKKK